MFKIQNNVLIFLRCMYDPPLLLLSMTYIHTFIFTIFVLGKPRGIRTARKLRTHRRDQKWHDKDYKKAHLGTRWKANPFGGASHAKGIVLEKV